MEHKNGSLKYTSIMGDSQGIQDASDKKMHAYTHTCTHGSKQTCTHTHTQAEALEMIFEELHDSIHPSHRKNV